MSSVCDFCLNYESKNESTNVKNKETCLESSFKIDSDTGEMICENFMLAICPDVSSAIIERFLKKDIDFYDNLSDLTSLVLSIFAYQSVFKIIFNIEYGTVELFDLTNSQHTYGVYNIKSIKLRKNIVSFEPTDDDFKSLILNIIEPNSLVFVEFEDFKHDYPIKGAFVKPNRFFHRDRISLILERFTQHKVWLE